MINKVKIGHIYFVTGDLVLFHYEAQTRCVVVCTGLENFLKLCHILEKSLKMKSSFRGRKFLVLSPAGIEVRSQVRENLTLEDKIALLAKQNSKTYMIFISMC